MHIQTLEALTQYQDKQEIPGIRGIIKVVFNPKAAGKPRGNLPPGTKQGIVITLDDGGEAIVNIYDAIEVPRSMAGKELVAAPGRDGNGKVGGLVYSPWEKPGSGEVSYYVDARKQSSVTIGGVSVDELGRAPAPPAQGQRPPAAPPANQSAPQAGTSQRAGAHAPTWSESVPGLEAAYNLCLNAAIRVIDKNSGEIARITGESPTGHMVCTVAASLFIECRKIGCPVPPVSKAPQRQAPPPPPPQPPSPPQLEDNGLSDADTDVPF